MPLLTPDARPRVLTPAALRAARKRGRAPADAGRGAGTPRARPEREQEDAADLAMQGLGFAVVKLSQPRAALQTAGVPDRLYLHERRGLAVWWEAKRPKGGRVSDAQRTMHAALRACGHHVVCGPAAVLGAWLRVQGFPVTFG